jgi:archaellin
MNTQAIKKNSTTTTVSHKRKHNTCHHTSMSPRPTDILQTKHTNTNLPNNPTNTSQQNNTNTSHHNNAISTNHNNSLMNTKHNLISIQTNHILTNIQHRNTHKQLEVSMKQMMDMMLNGIQISWQILKLMCTSNDYVLHISILFIYMEDIKIDIYLYGLIWKIKLEWVHQ